MLRTEARLHIILSYCHPRCLKKEKKYNSEAFTVSGKTNLFRAGSKLLALPPDVAAVESAPLAVAPLSLLPIFPLGSFLPSFSSPIVSEPQQGRRRA